MNMLRVSFCVVLLALALQSCAPGEEKTAEPTSAGAVPNTPVLASTGPAVEVSNDGTVLLFGNQVAIEDLQKGLLDSLMKMSELPPEIPIVFGNEVLMGTRQEIETQVNEALEAAKKGK